MKNALEFVRDSNSSLKLLTFQLSNVRKLETIKYAFGAQEPHRRFCLFIPYSVDDEKYIQI